MVTITTIRGILELPVPPPDDAMTIRGECGHGVSLFEPCGDCIVIEELVRMYAL